MPSRVLLLATKDTINVPIGLFAAISDLTGWDIRVVVASRCGTRPVGLTALPPPAGMAGAGLSRVGGPDRPGSRDGHTLDRIGPGRWDRAVFT